MASDIHIKIGDVKGESLDDKHKGEIEVLSWSWGAAQQGTMAMGGGAGAGKVSFQDFNFVHGVDKSSPVLWQACASGKHYPDATLTVRKAGKDQQEYLIIKWKEVFVTSVTSSGTGEGGQTTESVSLQGNKVELEYKPQKADGSLDAGVFFKYDLKANKSY
jgi:type VI secretion system secreted protein Hcp